MKRKKFILFGWILFFVCTLGILSSNAYSNGSLYESSLTVADSEVYDAGKLKGKVEITKTGKIELSIENLQLLEDLEYENKACTLVVETEVNDEPETYEFPFNITDGNAEEEMFLDTGLIKDDKIEIVRVVITGESTTTATPTPSPTEVVSPTPANSPVATATPVPTISPEATPAASPVSTPQPMRVLESLSTNVEILVPGGLITESEVTVTPTPISTATPLATPTLTITPTLVATPTPAQTPAAIEADVDIKTHTINLNSNGKFVVFIRLSSPYDIADIVCDTIECDGATPVKCKEKKNKYKVKFKIRDLDLVVDLDNGESQEMEFTVIGELNDGTLFVGIDSVTVKGENSNKNGNDDDDDDEDDEDDDKGKGKGKGKK